MTSLKAATSFARVKKSGKSFLAIIVFASASTLVSIAPSNAQTLSQAEISSTLIGVTLQWRNRRGTKGIVQYHSGGKLNWRNERGLKGAGEWRLDGNKLCTKIFKTVAIRGRDWKCDVVKTRTDGRHRVGSNTMWK